MQRWRLTWPAKGQSSSLPCTSTTTASHPGTGSLILVEEALRVSCAEHRCVQCKRLSKSSSVKREFCSFILPYLLRRSFLIFGLRSPLFFKKRGIARDTI